MFPRRYFPARLFAPRYFPQSQGESAAADDPRVVDAAWAAPDRALSWQPQPLRLSPRWAAPARGLAWSNEDD